mmetsp:Transcript_14368/g.45233  ORF Transcript_14368/g.45233 Transcript_14368/m.45233 type:complete len:214 (-) Transcript_14368:994-1635(-)
MIIEVVLLRHFQAIPFHTPHQRPGLCPDARMVFSTALRQHHGLEVVSVPWGGATPWPLAGPVAARYHRTWRRSLCLWAAQRWQRRPQPPQLRRHNEALEQGVVSRAAPGRVARVARSAQAVGTLVAHRHVGAAATEAAKFWQRAVIEHAQRANGRYLRGHDLWVPGGGWPAQGTRQACCCGRLSGDVAHDSPQPRLQGFVPLRLVLQRQEGRR